MACPVGGGGMSVCTFREILNRNRVSILNYKMYHDYRIRCAHDGTLSQNANFLNIEFYFFPRCAVKIPGIATDQYMFEGVLDISGNLECQTL